MRNVDQNLRRAFRAVSTNRLWRRFAALFCVTALLLPSLAALQPAHAQRQISLIRDTEIEGVVRAYAAPILGAAGLGGSNIKIVLVNDKSFNAFVADGRHIYMNVGTLMQSKTPNEVIGVIAHEVGHLAGNHLAGLRDQIRRAQTIAAISMIIGAAVAAGGAAAGQSDVARSGSGVLAGGQSVAQRTLLSYQRVQELSADRAAITYLHATKQSAAGMLSVFERFADQTMFSSRFIDPYAQSHPMPRERINQAQRLAKQSRYFGKRDSKRLTQAHAMMRAKLSGYLEGKATVARRYPRRDKSLEARYARAVAVAYGGSPRKAVRQIDALIKASPKNPFFWELKGQTLFESGKVKQAVPALKKAVALAPNAGLIRVLYGSALVESGNKSALSEAVRQLEKGVRQGGDVSQAYRYLGQAYQRQGKTGMAQVAAALEAFTRGDYKSARLFAKRAQAKLKRGSPGWLRADDILAYKPPRT